jgi:hypothetical protein
MNTYIVGQGAGYQVREIGAVLRASKEYPGRGWRTIELSARADVVPAYCYFAEYVIHDDGAWEEGRSWAGAISVEELFRAMRSAGLLKEITTTKQSGGE